MPVPSGRYGGETLSALQVNNVTRVFNVGRRMGATDRDLVIAAITTRVESEHGLTGMSVPVDSDSLGIFQQRPSQGWGTAEQVKDIEYASGAFFRELFKIKNRNMMTPGAAAQAVQRSRFPGKYDLFVAQGNALVAAYTREGGTSGTIGSNDELGILLPDLPNPLDPLTKSVSIITDTKTWLRVGMVLLGAALLFVALMKLTGNNQLSTTTKAVVGAAVFKGKK